MLRVSSILSPYMLLRHMWAGAMQPMMYLIAQAIRRSLHRSTMVYVVALLLSCSVINAWSAGPKPGPTAVPRPPSIPVRAYVMEDFHSGKVLAEHNADERLEPASLTKIMTSYVAFHELERGNIALAEEVVVSERAWRMPGSRMFIEVGTRVSVENLIKGVIVQSGNDASVALAEHIAGSEESFAGLMNEHARELGMTNTNFVNAEGLPHPDHYTSARDIAALTRAMIARFPDRYRLYSTREFTYNKISQNNRNRLLRRDDSVDGVKTGYTKSAGYCLVSSAVRDDMRLITVLLGSKSAKARFQQGYSLLTYGFRFFETHRLFSAREPVQRIRVWEGAASALGVGIAEDLHVTVPRGRYKELKTVVKLQDRAVAPISEGDPRGMLHVVLADEVIERRHLIALQSVAEGGLWKRLTDRVRNYFE
jgi:D-alanyl-D-alanine carboxypeptidase (penicillin-binding protein 5/6)